jgi:hypothetical protein
VVSSGPNAGLACSGTGDLSGYTGVSTSMTEPWKAMNLPIEGGTVVYSDGNTISVTYSGGNAAEIGKKYAAAIKGAGWSETTQSEMGGMFSGTYAKDGGTLALAAAEAMGTVTVSISKM